MTIDEQLRQLARRADEHQQAITVDEILRRTPTRRGSAFTIRAVPDRSVPTSAESTPFTEEDITMIDIDDEPTTTTTGPNPRRKLGLVGAALLAAAAVVAVAIAVRPTDDPDIPTEPSPTEPSPTVPDPTVPVSTVPAAELGAVPAGDATIVPGTYRVPSSDWSNVGFDVTFPSGWTVQYGHVYASNDEEENWFGFEAAVVDDIWADGCAGSNGESIDVGPGVDDLTAALLRQSGPTTSEPVQTSLGGFPATRIDLTVPADLDLSGCNAADVGLQIWYIGATDQNFVLLADSSASVYIVDVDGERQVFISRHSSMASDGDLEELRTVLESIRIQAPEPSIDPNASPSDRAIPAGDGTIEAGTYDIPRSDWSVADFTVTFPEDWSVQYGHVYARNRDDGEFGFYAVQVDAIYADPCQGSNTGEVVDVGPTVDDLVAALLAQPGPVKSEPIDTTFGGRAATRIDLTVPADLDLSNCNVKDMGLQIWHSAPADKYFVLLADGTASVYVVEVDGRRQVFVTQHSTTTTDAELAELQTVLDSIVITP